LLNRLTELGLPYVPKRQKQVSTGKNPLTGREESRKADIVVFDAAEWERLRQSSSSAAAYVAPPMVIEVVSTNWREDYENKLGDYEQIGISEYWIADHHYAGLGGIRFIGKPKQPTLTVYTLTDGEYQPTPFRGSDIVISPTLPHLGITVDRFFAQGY
jgi:Uma2 family endonuclease